ncbi:hypothetical protein ACGF0K_36935 [Streptomyces sp. NPDC048156]|uniref:hypothetical protein n=1 Tax=Streptomyces sp. NPDC048156 TaxID=3365502 RepID=UPI00371424FA
MESPWGVIMVPGAKEFFAEVRAAYVELADELPLVGPVESDLVGPSTSYAGGQIEYSIFLDRREGVVFCTVELDSVSSRLRAGLEEVAVASGVVERRGRISESARNMKQMKKSLLGQVEYVRLVHSVLSGEGAEQVMRDAGAKESPKRA